MNRTATSLSERLSSGLSLRSRLFFGLGALVVLLVLAQLWLVRSLTRELSAEVDAVALQIGSTVASFFAFSSDEEGATFHEIKAFGEESDDEIREVDVHGVQIHGGQLKSMARKLEDASGSLEVEGTATQVWVWSPGSDELIQVTGDEVDIESEDVRLVIPGGAAAEGIAVPGGPEDCETHETVGFGYQVESRIDSQSGDTRQIRTLRLPSGRQAQVHLGGDIDARFLKLERPDLKAEVPIPRLGLHGRIERFRERLWLGSGLLLLLGLVAAGYVSHRVSTPLAELADAAEKVGVGELGVQVRSPGGGREIRRTQEAFNAMSGRLRDLDERNRSLEALRHLEEIGDVARGLAHSLRNPLNALGLSVEQLAGSEISDERKQRLVDTAGRQVRRLDAGIRSFLVLASPGEGAGVEEVTASELVRDVALEALQDAGGRVGLDLDLEEGDIERLPAVVAELRAVVQALVVNAVEASPDGERVLVRLRSEEGGRMRLEIEDRGPGVAEDVRSRLFTPHVSTKSNGSGMGLFLAQRIAGFRYGGGVELLDRPGGGTLAKLVIGPRRRLHESEEPGSSEEPQCEDAARESSEGGGAGGGEAR